VIYALEQEMYIIFQSYRYVELETERLQFCKNWLNTKRQVNKMTSFCTVKEMFERNDLFKGREHFPLNGLAMVINN